MDKNKNTCKRKQWGGECFSAHVYKNKMLLFKGCESVVKLNVISGAVESIWKAVIQVSKIIVDMYFKQYTYIYIEQSNLHYVQ